MTWPGRREAGLSLVELGVSMFISMLVLALMGAWIVSANRMERFQGEAAQSLDEIRVAKDLLVKELRFANGLSVDTAKTNLHKVTFWVDSATQGTRGQPDAGIGEWVTWELTTDGRLLRSTDKTGDPITTQARGLVYNSAGAPGSAFTYPVATAVGIRLVADMDPSGGAAAEVIETRVTLRNA
jgi:Tfp pilus assembly protein PilW